MLENHEIYTMRGIIIMKNMKFLKSMLSILLCMILCAQSSAGILAEGSLLYNETQEQIQNKLEIEPSTETTENTETTKNTETTEDTETIPSDDISTSDDSASPSDNTIILDDTAVLGEHAEDEISTDSETIPDEEGLVGVSPYSLGTLHINTDIHLVTDENLQTILEDLYTPEEIADATTLVVTGNQSDFRISDEYGWGMAESINYLNELNITSIDFSGFTGTFSNFALANATIITTIALGNIRETLPSGMFMYCTELTTLSDTLANATLNPKVIDIEKTGLTSLGGAQFDNCSSITTVTLGSLITLLPNDVFTNCESLTTISNTVANATTNPGIIDLEKTGITSFEAGGQQFRNCGSITTVTLGNAISMLPVAIFSNNISLTTISNTVANAQSNPGIIDLEKTGITVLGEDDYVYYGGYQFAGCVNITTVTLGNQIDTLRSSVFTENTSLTTISNTVANAQANIGIIDLEKTGVTNLATRGWQFADCPNITKVTLGQNITSIPTAAFVNGTSLVAISDTAMNVMLNDDVIDLEKTGVTSLIGVNGADGRQFENCSSITKVTLGQNITSLPTRVFMNCTSLVAISNTLTNVMLNDDAIDLEKTGVTSLEGTSDRGGRQFENCTSLTKITLGQNITSLPFNVFFSCTSLVTLSDTLSNANANPDVIDLEKTGIIKFETSSSASSYIGRQFEKCTSITKVTLGQNITSLPVGVFRDCQSLVAISDTLINIMLNDDVIDLEKTGVTILEGTGNRHGYQFYGCSSITKVTLGQAITSLPTYVFYDCKNLIAISDTLANVTLNDDVADFEKTGVTQFESGGAQFRNCVSLTTVTLGSISYLPANIFSNYMNSSTTNLTTLADTLENARGKSAGLIDLGIITDNLDAGGHQFNDIARLANPSDGFYIDKASYTVPSSAFRQAGKIFLAEVCTQFTYASAGAESTELYIRGPEATSPTTITGAILRGPERIYYYQTSITTNGAGTANVDSQSGHLLGAIDRRERLEGRLPANMNTKWAPHNTTLRYTLIPNSGGQVARIEKVVNGVTTNITAQCTGNVNGGVWTFPGVTADTEFIVTFRMSETPPEIPNPMFLVAERYLSTTAVQLLPNTSHLIAAGQPYTFNGAPPVVPGYTYVGWIQIPTPLLHDAPSTPSIPSVTEHIQVWLMYEETAAESTSSYKVKHYQQDLGTNTYTEVVADEEDLTGITDALATYTAKNYTGFTFANSMTTWEDSGTPVGGTALGISGDGSLVIRVYYTRNSNNVSYSYIGTVPSAAPAEPATATAQFGEEVFVENVPTLAGYTFSGWNVASGGVTVDGMNKFTMLNAPVVFEGSWTESTDTVYKVRHYQQDLGANTYTEVVEDEQNLTGTTDVSATYMAKSYTGFTFANNLTTWENAEMPASATAISITGNGSLIIRLYYERNVHTITYNYTGTVPSDAPVEPAVTTAEFEEQVLVSNEPTLAGHTFSGWSIASGGITVDSMNKFVMLDVPVVFEGHWTVNPEKTYIVKHYRQDLRANTYTEVVEDEQSLTETADMPATYMANTYTGFTFANNLTTWEDTGTPASGMPLSVATDGSLVIRVYYTRNSHNISYNYTGTVPSDAPVEPAMRTAEFEEEVFVASEPTLAGYTFSGWSVVSVTAPISYMLRTWEMVRNNSIIIDSMNRFRMLDASVVFEGFWVINAEEEVPKEEPPEEETPEEEVPREETPEEEFPDGSIPESGQPENNKPNSTGTSSTKENGTPLTGDEARILLLAIIAFISSGVLVAVIVCKAHKKKEDIAQEDTNEKEAEE